MKKIIILIAVSSGFAMTYLIATAGNFQRQQHSLVIQQPATTMDYMSPSIKGGDSVEVPSIEHLQVVPGHTSGFKKAIGDTDSSLVMLKYHYC